VKREGAPLGISPFQAGRGKGETGKGRFYSSLGAAGWHDAFPAYEIIINGQIIHEYSTPDPGPTTWNLGGWTTVSVDNSAVIDPPEN
jgi:hypothetical protein